MSPRVMAVLLVVGGACLLRPGLSCPSGCRCYSLTVECGSIGIKEIPQGVPTVTETIFLQDNAITQIRLQDMSRLGQLHYLYLQNNSISALEPGAFSSLGQLLELALNGNLIHLVSPDMFRGLEHLRILYLAGNQITRVQDYTFRGLQRLQELHLQENSIELLAERALMGLSSLALLDLSRNHLRTLGSSSLTPLVSLQVLRVTENPWRCDCALGWLRTWISEDGQRLLSSAEQRRLMCSEPPRLSHLSLVEVAPNSLVCIPPVVQLEPSHLTVRLGESLRVSCQASGYPQPLVTWKKASHGKAQLSPRGLVQEIGPNGDFFKPGTGGVVTALPSSSKVKPEVLDISQEPLYEQDSMDFNALGPATQTAIAVGISLLALTAVLLLIMIYSRHQQFRKEEGASCCSGKEEGILYMHDYSEGPSSFAQLEEYRDDDGHEMYVFNRSKSSQGTGQSKCHMVSGFVQQKGIKEVLLDHEVVQTLSRSGGMGLRRNPGDGGEGPLTTDPEELFLSQSLLFGSQVAYEIHC
uniref:Ig-like domain-containing protein n=1 Tax=Knipowitschia caucasica TaxID=637954 RepID=A0AAV2JRJ3_KNICA